MPADAFWEFIQGGYIPPWEPESHEQNTVVMDMAADVARRYASAGYTTILEGIVLPQWFLDPVRAVLAEAGCSVSYAVLRAPLEQCIKRAGARDFKPVEDPAVVEQVWRQFSDLGRWEPHAIDVRDATPDDVAELLARRLAAGDLLCP